MVKFRKFILFILIALSTFGEEEAYGQNYYVSDKRTFYGGLTAGATFAQVDGDNFAGYNKFGLTGGAIVYAEIAKHFAASLEILYSQRGSNANKTQLTTSGKNRIDDYQIDLSYVEMPLLFNYFDKRKSHFGAGVSYAQLISQKETIRTTPSLSDTVDLSLYPFKKSDINAVVSLNLYLAKGFFLNVRYQYSLVSIRDNYYLDFARANANKQSNNFWVLRLMYLFE